MAVTVQAGQYYEFERTRAMLEVGRCIPYNFAQSRLRAGRDVYTPTLKDARALAKSIVPGKAEWEGAHEWNYFPHLHPGETHGTFGHVFYGERGYRQGESRRG